MSIIKGIVFFIFWSNFVLPVQKSKVTEKENVTTWLSRLHVHKYINCVPNDTLCTYTLCMHYVLKHVVFEFNKDILSFIIGVR